MLKKNISNKENSDSRKQLFKQCFYFFSPAVFLSVKNYRPSKGRHKHVLSCALQKQKNKVAALTRSV